MMSTPNPSWYDILGVDRTATPEQIKAAWRAATDKFEPGAGSSQFRLFNEAADVLLDPERRAAYDAQLGDAAPAGGVSLRKEEPEAAAATEPEAEPVAAPSVDTGPDTGPDAEPDAEPDGPSTTRAGLLGRLARVGTLWVALLAVVAVAAVVAVVLLAGNIRDRVDRFEAGPEASAAAERALTAVLSYDYRHMEADRDRAVRFLTPKYEQQYLKTFALLTEGPDGTPGGAVKTKAVVTADVLDTAVSDTGDGVVRVVVFVNQSSVKGGGQPAIFQNRVVATMVQRDGSWLVDNITSY